MARLTGFGPASIPGPPGPPLFPFQVNALRLLVDPIERLSVMRRLGDVVAVADRSPAVVCAFGPERNREVLSNPAVFETDDTFFIDFPEGSSVKQLLSGLPFRGSEVSRRHRQLLMPALQKRAIEGYAADIVSVTARVLDRWPAGSTANVGDLLCTLVQHVAVQAFFGVPPEEGVQGLGQLFCRFVELVASPWTIALPLRLRGLPYDRAFETADRTVRRLLALFAEKRGDPDARDALALILRARDEAGRGLSDDELIGEAASLFIAGYETQARTLAWALLLLDQHPRIRADVDDEIASALRGAPPTVADLPRMPLVEQVIKETMRVLAPVPTLFLRVCQAETRLGPYTLPKQANVLLTPFLTHRDPEIFAEPTRFQPRRWEQIKPTLYEYLPYGAGARLCLGAAFASQAMRLILPMVLQRFRLTLGPETRVDAQVRANILRPRSGLPMRILPAGRGPARGARAGGSFARLVQLPDEASRL